MTPEEFARRTVGMPWKRWASSWERCDCFGLVALYHREVLGLDPGPVPQSDIATGFAASSGWVQCSAQAGATAFMSWHQGAPTHCGIVLPSGDLLHCREGSPIPETGSVRINAMRAMQRMVPDLRFYRYTGGAAC
jgi:cell wall-associated NlpC family hydrolase